MNKIVRSGLIYVAGIATGFAALCPFMGEKTSGSAEVTKAPTREKPRHERPARADKAKMDMSALAALNSDEDADETSSPQDNRRRRRDEGRGRGFGSPGQWLKEMRENNPEAYTHITNQMVHMSQSRREDVTQRIAFLESIDLQFIPEESRESHEALAALLKERQEHEETMMARNMSEEEMTEEQMRSDFSRMMELNRNVSEALEKERDVLISATVARLGLSEEDAQAVMSTLAKIEEVTTETMPPRPRRRGGRGERGGRD